MNKLIFLGLMVENSNADRFLIRPPTNKLLRTDIILLAIGFILVTVTVNSLAAIITIPIMVYWGFLYYLFCKIWISYQYSIFYLIAAPLTIIVLSISGRYIINLLF